MGVDQMQLDELAIRPNGFRPNGNVPFPHTQKDNNKVSKQICCLVFYQRKFDLSKRTHSHIQMKIPPKFQTSFSLRTNGKMKKSLIDAKITYSFGRYPSILYIHSPSIYSVLLLPDPVHPTGSLS